MAKTSTRPTAPEDPDRGLIDLVLLPVQRIQDAMDDAVARGRMTREDANELVGELVRYGRRQTRDLVGDVEQLLGRSREGIETAAGDARRRARRAVGLPASFPVPGYDDLTAAKVVERLEGLTPAELRKVGDYERAHANRKSVLAAVEKRLG